MKKFLLGFLCGIAATFLALYLISRSNKGSETGSGAGSDTENVTGVARLKGVTLLDEPKEFTASKKFKVMQVIEDGALAISTENISGLELFRGPVVYLLSDGANMYYDDQIVQVPSGQKAMQIGTYQYMSGGGTQKTVPVIQFQ